MCQGARCEGDGSLLGASTRAHPQQDQEAAQHLQLLQNCADCVCSQVKGAHVPMRHTVPHVDPSILKIIHIGDPCSTESGSLGKKYLVQAELKSWLGPGLAVWTIRVSRKKPCAVAEGDFCLPCWHCPLSRRLREPILPWHLFSFVCLLLLVVVGVCSCLPNCLLAPHVPLLRLLLWHWCMHVPFKSPESVCRRRAAAPAVASASVCPRWIQTAWVLSETWANK